MSTTYEWDIETLDDSGDVIDHDQRAMLSSFDKSHLQQAIKENRLSLVRDVNDGGLDSRSWAYACPSCGMLNENMLDSDGRVVARVPSRFFKEFAKATE